MFITMFIMIIVVCSLKSMCIPCFGRCVSELRGHLVSIVMYGLRPFIIVLQELHCLLNCLHICMIREKGGYHFTEFLCSTPSGF